MTLALPFDHGRGEDWSDAHRPAAPVQHSEVATVRRAPPDLLAAGPRWGQPVERIAANVAGMIAHHVSAIWAIDNTGSRFVPNRLVSPFLTKLILVFNADELATCCAAWRFLTTNCSSRDSGVSDKVPKVATIHMPPLQQDALHQRAWGTFNNL